MQTAEEMYQDGLKALQDGDFSKAELSFRGATQLNQEDFSSWNLLGLTYQFQKKWQQCYASWKQALRCKPGCIDTQLNLGIACIAVQKPKEAEEFWLAILQEEPAHVQSLINLGLFYREREKNQQAHDMWERANIEIPEHPKVREWLGDVKGVLGMVALASRNHEEAEALLTRAVVLDPNYAVLWGYLAELHFQKKEFKEAFAICSKALNLEPENAHLHHSMGNILRMTGQLEQALVAYEKALSCGSRHPATYRAIAELRGAQVDEDEAVVQQLFDQYADAFDTELQEKLAYATPQKSHDLFVKHLVSMEYRSVLDLGCGTGLSIAPFLSKPITAAVGVDISSRMLELAEKKNLYTELCCASLREFIQKEERSFDVILCLDALVYVRSLEDIFVACQDRLSHGGVFLFSTEHCTGEEPILQSSGRYAHPHAYIRGMIREQNWILIAHEKTLLRKDGDHWIEGDIWLLGCHHDKNANE